VAAVAAPFSARIAAGAGSHKAVSRGTCSKEFTVFVRHEAGNPHRGQYPATVLAVAPARRSKHGGQLCGSMRDERLFTLPAQFRPDEPRRNQIPEQLVECVVERVSAVGAGDSASSPVSRGAHTPAGAGTTVSPRSRLVTRATRERCPSQQIADTPAACSSPRGELRVLKGIARLILDPARSMRKSRASESAWRAPRRGAGDEHREPGAMCEERPVDDPLEERGPGAGFAPYPGAALRSSPPPRMNDRLRL